MTAIPDQIIAAAQAFLAETWMKLNKVGVVPPSPYRRRLSVGRDYFGDDVRPGPAYKALETAIETTYPRFDPARPLMEQEFASSYLFPFLETFIYRMAESGKEFTADGPAAQESIRDLHTALSATTFETVCCRAVSRMTTLGGQPITFTHVRVEPVVAEAHEHTRRQLTIIEDAVPGGARVCLDADRHMWGPPESILIAREAGEKVTDLAESASSRIGRFLLLVRLLKPGFSESMFEVQGTPTPISPPSPYFVQFRGPGPAMFQPAKLAARDIVLSPADGPRVDGLGQLLDSLPVGRPGMVFTSLSMALSKFTLSYHSYSWHEQLVDLATAFEAAFAGVNGTDVSLRLRTRAATLLATPTDLAAAIFDDMKILYGLRPKLVHGGSMSVKSLMKEMRNLSTVPSEAYDGELSAHTVERLRDLVRRAILARICLASGASPLWPLDLERDDIVDAALADDQNRSEWRDAWHATVSAFDAAESASPPPGSNLTAVAPA